MQNISRWIPALAALVLTAACSDTQTATAPMVPASISAELHSTACDLSALELAIADAEFFGKKPATDEENLLFKVDAAKAKLAQGKTADAIQKLEDIRATVVALSTAAKPKLDATDANAINQAVDAAEACISILTAT